MPKTIQILEKTVAADSTVNVVGMLVDVCDHDSAAARIIELVRQKKGGYVCAASVHMIMEARDNPVFAEIVRTADFVAPDGMPVVWMQKLQGAKNAARVRGVDLMQRLFAEAQKLDLSVGFYGGKQEVLDEISKRLDAEFPQLRVGYIYSPPFRVLSTAEGADIVAAINESASDILFVGLGCPKQEYWMAEHREQLDLVMLGVGAAFDFYAGNIKEAPGWVGNLGLEWLVRLIQEPRRLWKRYILLNPRFIWLAAMQLMGLKKFK